MSLTGGQVGRVLAAEVLRRLITTGLVLLYLRLLEVASVRRTKAIFSCHHILRFCNLQTTSHHSNAQQVHIALKIDPLVIGSIQYFARELILADN